MCMRCKRTVQRIIFFHSMHDAQSERLERACFCAGEGVASMRVAVEQCVGDTSSQDTQAPHHLIAATRPSVGRDY